MSMRPGWQKAEKKMQDETKKIVSLLEDRKITKDEALEALLKASDVYLDGMLEYHYTPSDPGVHGVNSDGSCMY
jgi:hypothetical protein